MLPHRDQFSGCLIGQCLGDALGFVVEGFAPAACKRYVEDILRSGKAGEFGQWPFPFGQYSDDSQFARELLLLVNRDAETKPEFGVVFE